MRIRNVYFNPQQAKLLIDIKDELWYQFSKLYIGSDFRRIEKLLENAFWKDRGKE